MFQSPPCMYTVSNEEQSMMKYVSYKQIAYDRRLSNQPMQTVAAMLASSIQSTAQVPSTNKLYTVSGTSLSNNKTDGVVIQNKASGTQTSRLLSTDTTENIQLLSQQPKQPFVIKKTEQTRNPKKKKKKRDPNIPPKQMNPKCLANLKQFKGHTEELITALHLANMAKGIVQKNVKHMQGKNNQTTTVARKAMASKKKPNVSGRKRPTTAAKKTNSGVTKSSSGDNKPFSGDTKPFSGSKKTIGSPGEKKPTTQTVYIKPEVKSQGPSPAPPVVHKKIELEVIGPIKDGIIGKKEAKWLQAQISENPDFVTQRGAKMKAQKRINDQCTNSNWVPTIWKKSLKREDQIYCVVCF